MSRDVSVLRLRPFTEADDAELLTWFATPADLRRFAGPNATWPPTGEQLARWREDPLIEAWSAAKPADDRLLGHVQIVATGPGTSRLARVAIAPRERGAGLGRELVSAAPRRADARRIASVDLHVYEDDEPAVRLYASLGCTDLGPHPGQPTVKRMRRRMPAG